MAVHEVMMFDATIRDLVHNNAPIGELRRYALESGMVPLRDSALQVLNQGTTTLEEIINITHGV
jgi:type II secretory ATPase GspE/PulE/Tfp pilus assembly ATPase PilB-like protein